MTKSEFLAKVAFSEAGTRIVYHSGWLMADREKGLDCLAVNALAHAAMAEVETGRVRLLQRKLGPSKYEYVAQKLPAPFRPAPWEGCYAVDKYVYPDRKRSHPDAAQVGPAVLRKRAARCTRAPEAAHA